MSARSFYSAFEDRHRESRTLIKQRLNVYLPFVKPLLRIHGPRRALDLSCGRGEWLQLLQEHGFEVQGVDLDEAMVAACDELGLPVAQEDAIEHLRSIDNDSQSIISGFHIAEHLVFSDLQALITESLRVLKPGGLLILETPKPENIIVGTMNFYLDPTYNKPLRPELLTFLAERQGFKKVKILRLQERPDLLEKSDVNLIDVLGGVSPDFSIIAQKQTSARVLEQFGSVFDSEYDVTLRQLAERYDASIDHRLGAFEQRITDFENKSLELPEALNRLVCAEVTIAQQARQLADVEQRAVTAESRSAEMEQHTASLEARVAASSRPWRRKVARYPLILAMKVVLNRPGLANKVNRRLLRYPGLHDRLRSMARELGVRKDGNSEHFPETGAQLANLSPRTQRIYELKTTLERKGKEIT